MVTEEAEARVQVDENLVVVDEVEEDELGLAMVVTTHWHATGAGCVAIWPVTAPKPDMFSHREVAMLALPAGNSLNPCRKAQEDEEEEVAQYASVV